MMNKQGIAKVAQDMKYFSFLKHTFIANFWVF